MEEQDDSLAEHAHCNIVISTQSVALSYTDLYSTLNFVNESNYKKIAMQCMPYPTHATSTA
jgi:hypothetical protein